MCGVCADLVAQKAQKKPTRSTKNDVTVVPFVGFSCAFSWLYFPKMTQSPCEVPINSNIGNDNHAFVRDAMKA